LGVGFAVLFVGVEWARMVLLLPPAAPLPGARLEGRVLGPYLAAAAAQPWTPQSIALALPRIMAASLVGAGIGWLLAQLWMRARDVAVSARRPGRSAAVWSRVPALPRAPRGNR